MAKYLGSTIVDIKDTKFKDFTPFDWAMYFIECYGQIDGEHHKSWVLDQVARIYNGSNIVVKLKKWDDGSEEYSVMVDEPTEAYHNWVLEMKGFEKINDEYRLDPDNEYSYYKGIAP